MRSFALDAFCYIKSSKVGAHIKATWTAQRLYFSVQDFLLSLYLCHATGFQAAVEGLELYF